MLKKIKLKYRHRLSNSTRALIIQGSIVVIGLYGVSYGGAVLGQDGEESDARKAAARVNYMLQCQGCHLANGRGSTQAVPDMTEHGVALLHTELGRQFFIQVPGSSNAPLDDQELSDVLNFIVSDVIRADGVALFTESEVARSRGEPIADVIQYRRRLIERIQSDH